MMFEKGPAAKTLNCCLYGCFINDFSSGSTNAAGIMGTKKFLYADIKNNTIPTVSQKSVEKKIILGSSKR